jgi:hypothetical protein
MKLQSLDLAHLPDELRPENALTLSLCSSMISGQTFCLSRGKTDRIMPETMIQLIGLDQIAHLCLNHDRRRNAAHFSPKKTDSMSRSGVKRSHTPTCRCALIAPLAERLFRSLRSHELRS